MPPRHAAAPGVLSAELHGARMTVEIILSDAATLRSLARDVGQHTRNFNTLIAAGALETRLAAAVGPSLFEEAGGA